MSYDDFWFIDTRVQTRNFRRYFIWFILLFAFVTIGTILAVRSMYKDIELYRIQDTNPIITVQEAKATNVNGYIKGNIINDQEEDVTNKVLIFFLYNSENELLSTETLDIGTLSTNQSKTYEFKFRVNNVDRFLVAITDKE